MMAMVIICRCAWAQGRGRWAGLASLQAVGAVEDFQSRHSDWSCIYGALFGLSWTREGEASWREICPEAVGMAEKTGTERGAAGAQRGGSCRPL